MQVFDDLPVEEGEEVWEIEGFPDYFVTSQGRIISGPSIKYKGYVFIKPQLNKKSTYYQVGLYSPEGKCCSKDVHVLVAKEFIPNPEGKRTVQHKNGDKSENTVDNLEWFTHVEQQAHSLSSGLRPLGVDWGISRNGRRYQLQITLPGTGNRKSFGYFETKEEARGVRDSVCREHGMIRPILEVACQ
jgi:hypothetical protein